MQGSEQRRKYGFVYLWYDRKSKRFYIGCHWGYEGDGYICSSRWMRQTYKRRPQDFKGPRILKRVYTNRKDLLEEEYRWLSMIKPEELKVRYYNLHNHHFGHWSTDEHKAKIVREKCGIDYSQRPELKKQISNTLIEYFSDPEARERNKNKQIEVFSAPEMKLKMSEVRKKQWANTEFREMMIERRKGKVKDLYKTQEHKEKMLNITTIKRICPHCGKEGKGTAMTRYHFNNCKKRVVDNE